MDPHEVAGIEVVGIHPGEEFHVLVLRAEGDIHALCALCVHVVEQAADEVGEEVGAEGPAGAEIAKDPEHVRDAREHHAAIGDGIGEVQGLAVDFELDVAHNAEVEAGGGDDDVGLKFFPRLEQNAARREAVDFVGDHRGFARGDALEDVAIGDKGDALPPGAVVRGEVGLDVIVRAEEGADAGQQFAAFTTSGSSNVRLVKTAWSWRILRRTISWIQASSMSSSRSVSARSLRFRPGMKYVGERWRTVTWAQSAAMAGTTVAVVAPEPMTRTFLPL